MNLKGFKKLLTGLCLGAALMVGAYTAVSAAPDEKLQPSSEYEELMGKIEDNTDYALAANLSAPSNAKQTAATSTSVSFKWSTVSGATGYEVAIGPYKSRTSGSYKVLSSNYQKTSATISKLKPGTLYSIRLRARDTNKIYPGVYFDGLFTYAEKPFINKISTIGNIYTFYFNTSEEKHTDTIDGYHVTYTNMATGKSFTRTYKSKYNFSVELKPNIFYKMVIRSYFTDAKGKNHRNPAGITKYVALQPSLTKKSYSSNSMTVGWKKLRALPATLYTCCIRELPLIPN